MDSARSRSSWLPLRSASRKLVDTMSSIGFVTIGLLAEGRPLWPLAAEPHGCSGPEGRRRDGVALHFRQPGSCRGAAGRLVAADVRLVRAAGRLTAAKLDVSLP